MLKVNLPPPTESDRPANRRLLLNIPDDELRRIQADILARAKATDELLRRTAVVDNPSPVAGDQRSK